MKKYIGYGYELKYTLQDIAEKFENKGFKIEVWNCGTMFKAYLLEKMKYEEWFGHLAEDGCGIQVEETYRHNGTSENVNIDMRVYRYKQNCGSLQGKDEKKIRFRMDASENVKNKRIEEVVDRYNRFA